MPESLSASVQAGAFGRNYNNDISIVSEAGTPWSPNVPKAWAGQLTTRTDANTGVVTMTDPAHAIPNGSKVMVYWEDDVVSHLPGRRRFMSVTAVAGALVSLDLGAGDNFPTVLTNVIVCKMEQVNVVAIGADVVGLTAAAGGAECSFVFHDGAAAELLYIPLVAQDCYVYTSEMGIANPLAGVTTATVWCAHNNTLASQVCAGAVFFN